MSDRKVTIDITAEDNTSAIVRKIGNAFDSLRGKTRASSKASKELGGAFDAATARMVKFGASFLAAQQVAAFAKGCFDAAVSLDKLSKSYESITGNGYTAKQQLDFVLDTSRKLGLEYESTAEKENN